MVNLLQLLFQVVIGTFALAQTFVVVGVAIFLIKLIKGISEFHKSIWVSAWDVVVWLATPPRLAQYLFFLWGGRQIGIIETSNTLLSTVLSVVSSVTSTLMMLWNSQLLWICVYLYVCGVFCLAFVATVSEMLVKYLAKTNKEVQKQVDEAFASKDDAAAEDKKEGNGKVEGDN